MQRQLSAPPAASSWFSSCRKIGSISAQPHPGLPRAAMAWRTTALPRLSSISIIELDPPSNRPRVHCSTSREEPTGRTGKCHASVDGRRAYRAPSVCAHQRLPSASISRRDWGSTLSRLASTQPANTRPRRCS